MRVRAAALIAVAVGTWLIGGLSGFGVAPVLATPAGSTVGQDDPKESKPPELKFESTDPKKSGNTAKDKADSKKSDKKKSDTKKDSDKDSKRDSKEDVKKDSKEQDPRKDAKKGPKEDAKEDSKKGSKEEVRKGNGDRDEERKGEKRDSERPVKNEPFYYEYTTEEGDSLELVSYMYATSMERIKRWNKKVLPKRGLLKAGTVLKIYSDGPIRVQRKATYEVQKGDTLKKLVRKLKTSEKVLRAINGLKGSKLEPGRSLVYLTPATWPPSESVGKCSGGKLVNGEKLPAGPGYSFGSRPNVYGTNETVTLLLDIFGKFKKKYPKGPKLVVGNLSRNTGGALSPHKSHQSGRDVDLGYVIKKEYQPVTHMMNASEKNLDCEKTWFLMESIIKTGKVKYMFVDFEVQRILYEYLVAKKYPKAKLKKYFQYPDRGSEALIKHVAGHLHHIHLRFVCPKSDKECQD